MMTMGVRAEQTAKRKEEKADGNRMHSRARAPAFFAELFFPSHRFLPALAFFRTKMIEHSAKLALFTRACWLCGGEIDLGGLPFTSGRHSTILLLVTKQFRSRLNCPNCCFRSYKLREYTPRFDRLDETKAKQEHQLGIANVNGQCGE